MVRPLRIHYPGASYHVMNRGNRRARVFGGDDHYRFFLDCLETAAETFRVPVRCYCCMPNHFHLYVSTPEANLSRFMQGFLTAFTVGMNRRTRSSGHVFQGRYKAQLVEDEAYGASLSRYIHLNPVRIKRMRKVELAEKQKYLRRYAWSSYPLYLGVKEAPVWLDRDPVLRSWGRGMREQMRGYRRYVEEGLLRDVENPFVDIAEQSILGTDSFVDRIKREYLLGLEADRQEQRALVRLQESFSFEQALAAVSQVYEVEEQDLLERRSRESEARRVLMWSASRYCRYAHSLGDLARRCSVSTSGLAMARNRVEQSARRDRRLKKQLTRVKEALGVKA